MTNYTKLVKALRCKCDDCEGCELAFFDNDEGWMCQYAAKDDDAADAIEALQAEIRESMQRCAECGDELAHQMPKRGKWVEDTTTYAGPGLSNYKCSLCGKICGTWRMGLKQSELPNWCGNCGADMSKMEVQDG